MTWRPGRVVPLPGSSWQDDTAPLIADARWSMLDRVVRTLTYHRQDELRRARGAVRAPRSLSAVAGRRESEDEQGGHGSRAGMGSSCSTYFA